MNPTTLLGRIWGAIPNGLKKFVGYGVASGLAMGSVLFLWLLWGTGYIQEKLNIPTRADVERVKNEAEQNSEEEKNAAVMSIAQYAVRTAMDSARVAQDSLFNTMVKDVIRPGIDRQNRLFEQVRELNRRMGINNDKLDAQAQSSESAARTMMELRTLVDGTMNSRDRDELMRLMKKIDDDQERIKQKLKIKTQEF